MMNEVVVADSNQERPLFFPGGEHDLFGILTRPAGEANGVGVVLMTARGTYHRNRLSVRTARRLAEQGLHVIRFDFQGVGESSGSPSFEPTSPLMGNVTGAIDVLAAEGIQRYVLVGSCSGARYALAAADDIPRLEGVVLAVMPFGRASSLPDPQRRHHWRRGVALAKRALIDPKSLEVLSHVVRAKIRRHWRRLQQRPERSSTQSVLEGRRVEGWLDRLVERRVPILLLFGAEDSAYRGFRHAMGAWPKSLQRELDQLLEVRVASQDRIHGHAGIEAQDWLLNVVDEWMRGRRFDRAPGS